MTSTRRHGTYIALSLTVAAATIVGCGSEDSGTEGDVAIIDTADGSGGDTGGGPDLPSCVDNFDCRGGEVCRDSYCREACGPDDPCAGTLAICDVDSGYCVGCLDDAQCPGGFCDLDAGVCEDAECAGDEDCRGGEACRGGRCVSIDEQVCEPDATRCEGDVLVSCSRDGTVEQRQTCVDPYRCGLADGAAACVRDVCIPDEVGCLDPTTAYVCDSTGTARTELPCPDGDVCEQGVCRPGICEGGSSRCDGDALVVCDELGTRENVIDCNATSACLDADNGCTCDDAECVERICLPGTAECAGNGVRQCAADGLSWQTIVPCEDGTNCIAGICASDECTPGILSCAGNTLLRCNGSGTGYTQTDCTVAGQSCIAADGTAACVARVCEPGSATCTADATTRLVCNALGTAQSSTACGAGRVCSSGACIDRVCTPGARRCAAGNGEVCNTLGTGWSLSDSCSVGEVCVDGFCELDGTGCRSSADCPPPSPTCDGSVFVQYVANGGCSGGTCDYRGVETRTDCATSGQSCTVAGCAGDVECTIDSDCGTFWGGICVGNRCVDCRTDGDCATTETCESNTCVPLDDSDCTSDAQCVALASALGQAEADARCRAGYGCYLPGYCNTAGDTTPPDPFGAACPSGLTCSASLFPILDDGSCSGCVDNTDCRVGEVCSPPLLIGSNYCSSVANPLPF